MSQNDTAINKSSTSVERKKPLTLEEIDQMLKKSVEDRAERDYKLLRKYPEIFHQDCQPTLEKGAWACLKERSSPRMGDTCDDNGLGLLTFLILVNRPFPPFGI